MKTNPYLVLDIKMNNALPLGYHDTGGAFIDNTEDSLISTIVISKHGAWEEDEIRQILRSMEKIMKDMLPSEQYVFKMETVELAE